MNDFEEWIEAAITTAFIGLVALFFVGMVIANQDCDRKGGVLMKPAFGGYTCVTPIRR
jgi:hypothetical protein